MTSRGVALIATAVLLSVCLLGVQLASGGGDFVPQRTADPCKDRGRPVKNDLEGLAEAVVLTGIDDAACKLGVSRERLLLALPSRSDRVTLAREAGTDEAGLAQAIKDGLSTGVDRLDQSHQLPQWSAVLPSVADQLGIPQSLIGLIPDSLVDQLPPIADVLHLALDKIEVNAVLEDLDSGKSLEPTLRDALVQAAIAEVKGRIGAAVPGPLQGLLD